SGPSPSAASRPAARGAANPSKAPVRIRYSVDPGHAAAQFKVRHLMVASVRGELGAVSGTVELDPANLASAWVEASIDATGVNTRNPERDAHLRSADFLDTEKFPTID